MNPSRLLTIAGSDSGGGAGIQGDLKTFAALGGYGMAVITAVTAQNTVGITAVHHVPADIVTHQIDAVIGDIGVDAVKIGMLGSVEIVEAVAACLRRHKPPHVVVDPVMVATSGRRLLSEDAMDAFRARLMPLADVLTPNIPEAEVLAGQRIDSESALERVARTLLLCGPQAVLVKGGHSAGARSDDGLAYREADEVAFVWLPGERLESRNTHGTGCALSSAMAAYLASGYSTLDAARAAKAYVHRAIRQGASLRLGGGDGPIDHACRDV